MKRDTRRAWLAWTAAPLLAAGLAACEGVGGSTGPVDGLEPQELQASYRWVLHGWEPSGLEPVGHAAVELMWFLPAEWDGEVFRVYARESGRGSFTLISTVTSCAQSICRYTDLNVRPGDSYEYFVATVDERTDREVSTPAVGPVLVPAGAAPTAPAAPSVTALDGALYLQWESTGAERYRVFLERIGSDSYFLEVGETDGTSFLDERAENGTEYAYRIAAIDTLGQYSARSALGAGIPRPDYHSELIWAFADSLGGSGFRFRASDAENPIVSGDAATAHWRLETINGVLSIRPLGATTVTRGSFTTALACGPESDPDCIAITEAPAASAFSSVPAPVDAGNTYVFRVTGDDGQARYAKIRVQGRTTDTAGRTVVIFDWAYQLVPGEPSLNRG